MHCATFLLSAILAASSAPALSDPNSNDKAALDAAFSAPEATWAPVAQGFWPDYRLFKLQTASSYHRPTIALGPQGQALVLTDNVLRVSAETTLAHFNGITLNQRVSVTANNLTEFADFFLRSYLLYADDACLSSTLPLIDKSDSSLPVSLCNEPAPFTVESSDGSFVIRTFLIHRKARTAWPKRFSIAPDGRITSVW